MLSDSPPMGLWCGLMKQRETRPRERNAEVTKACKSHRRAPVRLCGLGVRYQAVLEIAFADPDASDKTLTRELVRLALRMMRESE